MDGGASMCGFAGIRDTSQSTADLVRIARRMTDTLAPRGPDGEGVFVGEGVALGHRRLSILDLSTAGSQPMTLAAGGPTIAFNGEVYNFPDLRNELSGRGHRFKGSSDTEVMLHAYAEWGLQGLRRFEGIFAFAIWDPGPRRLILMRDRLGVKPLFYARAGERIVFGSEIKAVMAAEGVDTSLDDQALSEYLWYGNAYEDRTIYRSVRSLLPGHWLIMEGGKTRTEPWWTLEEWLAEPQFAGTQAEAANEVRAAVDAAVKRQLVADVPVGLFLSGGTDSSAIAAAAMHVQAKPLSSFCVGFDFDRGVNELPKARQVAKHLGLDHHEVRVTATNLREDLIALARAHDEPFADAANVPLFLLAKQLRGSIKVVLQGDGGDEMFAGYRRYAILRNSSFWSLWPRPLTPLFASAGGSLGERFARMAEAAGAPEPALRMALLLTVETLSDPPTAFLEDDARERLAAVDPFLAYRRCAARFAGRNWVDQMLLTDISLQLPSQFLAKVDRSTMACGLEARVPLLDEKVARLAVRLPVENKVSRTEKKIALRAALRGRIPDSVLDAPKTGFGVPYEFWLKGSLYDMAREAVLDPAFLSGFGFSGERLERALEEHRAGSRERGFTLWKVFQLALWSSECKGKTASADATVFANRYREDEA
jgi:asparagine synthase (glutamine-hydrolysing)